MKNSLILTLATVLLAGCQLFAQPSDTTIQPLEEPEETTQDTQDQEVEFAPVDYDRNIRIPEELQSLVPEDELLVSYMPSLPDTDSPQHFTTVKLEGPVEDNNYTAKIYIYSGMGGPAIEEIYQETGNLLELRILGIVNRYDLVVVKEPVDYSPGPCFSHLTGESELFSLDLLDPQELEPFSLPQSLIQEEKNKVDICGNALNI